MTVIVYKDGVMAGDGRLTDKRGVIVGENDTKVFKTADYLVGVAGEADACQILLEATQNGNNPGKLKGTDGLRVSRFNQIEIYEGLCWFRVNNDYAGIGAGADFAMIACDLGFSAVEACRAAMKRHALCGGRIRKVSF